MNPLNIGKNALITAKRLQKTASVAGLSALRIAKGEKADAYLLKETFEKLGTTYIKLGQFIASTPSLFPKEYVMAFADCLDNTTPIHFDLVRAVLAEELAHLGTLDEIFRHIEPTPLASASIAQVHKAVLSTGEIVALKVQKPNVATVISTDLGVLHGAFWTLEKVMPSFKMTSLAPIMDEIKKRMMAETDFIAESQHLKKFHEFLTNTNNPTITTPKVYDHLTTKRVLTMEFLSGVSLIDASALAHIDDPKRLMNAILDTWFFSLLATGEFHADLHAGNLMLLDDQRVAFLDFGLVGSINPQSIKGCTDLVSALGQNDFLGVANAMIDIGMTHERGKINPEKLADDLQKLIGKTSNDHINTRTHAEQLNTLMAQVADAGKRHGIHFPRDFALLTKQLLYFDRFMVMLAPDMEMFDGERLQRIGGHKRT